MLKQWRKKKKKTKTLLKTNNKLGTARIKTRLKLKLMLKEWLGNSLAVQWLGLSTFTARARVQPAWGTKISQAKQSRNGLTESQWKQRKNEDDGILRGWLSSRIDKMAQCKDKREPLKEKRKKYARKTGGVGRMEGGYSWHDTGNFSWNEELNLHSSKNSLCSRKPTECSMPSQLGFVFHFKDQEKILSASW